MIKPQTGRSTPHPELHPPADYASEHADAIYSGLLRLHLRLSDEHRRKLRARGLPDAEITRNGYRSTPATRAGRERVAASLAPHLEAFAPWGGVPGFYKDGARWAMAYTAPGFFVPVRDMLARVRGLQIRVDEPRDGGKYLWLSSNPETTDERGRQRYPMGASSGVPFHCARYELLGAAEELLVTEGALKADVISYFTQAPVIGLAGTRAFRSDIGEELRRIAPRLRTALVAFDKDLLVKPSVFDALEALRAVLEAAGLRVRYRTWPGEAKGFDDYLLEQSHGREVRAA